MATGITDAGSPERRAWAEAGGHGGRPTVRPAKRGPDRTAVPEAVGGATAPLPVGAIHTPPAQKRRVQTFVSSASDTDGRLKDLTEMVKEEFTRVCEAMQGQEENIFELGDPQNLDNLQTSLDRRFAHTDSSFKGMDEVLKKINQERQEHQGIAEASEKIQDLETGLNLLQGKLTEFEK